MIQKAFYIATNNMEFGI